MFMADMNESLVFLNVSALFSEIKLEIDAMVVVDTFSTSSVSPVK